MAKLFRSNRSQAVRLPKEAEFPPEVKEVEVVVHGAARLLVPKVTSWAEFYELTPPLSDDFPKDIEELPQQERDFPWP